MTGLYYKSLDCSAWCFFGILHGQILILTEELCLCKKLNRLLGGGGVILEMHSILNSYGFVLGYVEFCFASLVVFLFTYNCFGCALKSFYICI